MGSRICAQFIRNSMKMRNFRGRGRGYLERAQSGSQTVAHISLAMGNVGAVSAGGALGMTTGTGNE